jgi:hypothetical protein
MLATTAIASPYLFSYDFPFLIQPVAWVLTDARCVVGACSKRSRWSSCGLLHWRRAAALPLHLNLMPVAGAALVAVVASRLGGPSDQSTIRVKRPHVRGQQAGGTRIAEHFDKAPWAQSPAPVEGHARGPSSVQVCTQTGSIPSRHARLQGAPHQPFAKAFAWRLGDRPKKAISQAPPVRKSSSSMPTSTRRGRPRRKARQPDRG